MSLSFVHLRRILFGASCALVFGFGATQALASPAQTAFYGCTTWDKQRCNNYCAANYPGSVGRCTDFGGYQCQCEYGPYIPNDP